MIPGEPAPVPVTEEHVTQAQPPSPAVRKGSPLSSGPADVVCSPDHKPKTVEIQMNVSRRTRLRGQLFFLTRWGTL